MSPQSSLARADFHLLAKPTGAVCHLDCKYCFLLSKEIDRPMRMMAGLLRQGRYADDAMAMLAQ